MKGKRELNDEALSRVVGAGDPLEKTASEEEKKDKNDTTFVPNPNIVPHPVVPTQFPNHLSQDGGVKVVRPVDEPTVPGFPQTGYPYSATGDPMQSGFPNVSDRIEAAQNRMDADALIQENLEENAAMASKVRQDGTVLTIPTAEELLQAMGGAGVAQVTGAPSDIRRIMEQNGHKQ